MLVFLYSFCISSTLSNTTLPFDLLLLQRDYTVISHDSTSPDRLFQYKVDSYYFRKNKTIKAVIRSINNEEQSDIFFFQYDNNIINMYNADFHHFAQMTVTPNDKYSIYINGTTNDNSFQLDGTLSPLTNSNITIKSNEKGFELVLIPPKEITQRNIIFRLFQTIISLLFPKILVILKDKYILYMTKKKEKIMSKSTKEGAKEKDE